MSKQVKFEAFATVWLSSLIFWDADQLKFISENDVLDRMFGKRNIHQLEDRSLYY